MATITKTVNPCVVAPGDTADNLLLITCKQDGENIVQVVITAGSFQLSAEGPVDASNSPVYSAGDSIPPFSSRGDKTILYFKDQTGSSSMNVSVL